MKKMRLFMLLTVLMLCLSGIASADTWEWVASDDIIGGYYARGSAVRLNDNRQTGHVKAWFKYQYEDENARRKMGRIIKKYSDKDTSDFYFTVDQEEYKNVNGTIYCRTLNSYAYDHSKKLICKLKRADSWKIVIPVTCGMAMYKRALSDAR